MEGKPQTPSPCPACSGQRSWSEGAIDDSGRRPVRCLGCARSAQACPDCGWEATGRPAGSRASGGCVSCLLTRMVAGRAAARQPVAPSILETGLQAAEDDIARADRSEATLIASYRCRVAFAAGVREAARRAQARARLESALRSLGTERRRAA